MLVAALRDQLAKGSGKSLIGNKGYRTFVKTVAADARRVLVSHPSLNAGQECEKCRRGKLRQQKPAGVAMQAGSPRPSGNWRSYAVMALELASRPSAITLPIASKQSNEENFPRLDLENLLLGVHHRV